MLCAANGSFGKIMSATEVVTQFASFLIPVIIGNTPWGREAIHIEGHRTRIMAATLCAMMLLSGIDFLFFRDSIGSSLGKPAFMLVSAWLLTFIVYELAVWRRIRWYQRRRFNLPRSFNYATGIIEVSFPSVLLCYLSVKLRQPWLLDSPLFLFYILAILLSVLHLNHRLCIVIAAVAAAQYVIIAYAAFHQPVIREGPIPENTHYIKAVILLLSGLLAGYVAWQLNQRVAAQIQAIDEKNAVATHFGQQVSNEVVTALLEQGHEARRLEVTILALDIRNFTTLVEHSDPDEILLLQNRIFDPLIGIIGQHKGIVNQIMGDGLMASFGAPVADAEHATEAFTAAVNMLKAFEKLNANGELPNIRLGIGLHCGDVITGNIGNRLRKQWSVSGMPVIVAFRLEQMNKELKTQLLMSSTVRERLLLPAKEFHSMGNHTPKGMEEGIEVFAWEGMLS